MFTLACKKHRQEYHEWLTLDKEMFPESTEQERVGRRLIFQVCKPVALDKCPDCRVVSMLKM